MSRRIVACPLAAEASLIPEWDVRVIGPGVFCFDNLDQLGHSPAGAILVIGLAGGLDADAQTGSVFQIRSVRCSNGRLSEPTASLSDFGISVDIPSAAIACVDHVVGSGSAKADLADRTGARLVDMESAHIARWCVINGWKWCMVRAVLDGPNDSLPPGIGNWCGRNGELNAWAMTRSLALCPLAMARLPWMARSLRVAGNSLRMALGRPDPSLARQGR